MFYTKSDIRFVYDLQSTFVVVFLDCFAGNRSTATSINKQRWMESRDYMTCVFVSSGSMHVSLAEALQVRGGPLQEEEVWAVLNQSAESLHELMRRGKAHHWSRNKD